MNAIQSVINKNPLTKKTSSLFLAGLLAAIMFGGVTPQKAQAAWVNSKAFDKYTLDLKCSNMVSYGLNKGAANYGGTVSDWYCVVIPPSWRVPNGIMYWIRPGDACKFHYGGSYSFVTTKFNSPYGGYCAQWR